MGILFLCYCYNQCTKKVFRRIYNMQKSASSPFHFRYKTLQDEDREKNRDIVLHKTLKKYQNLNNELAMKLFNSRRSQRHKVSLQNIKYICIDREKKDSQEYREQYLDRRLRRESLGLQEADIFNYTNRAFQRKDKMMKRKKMERASSNKFCVSEAVKKHNIKGFTAKISHSLGRQSCVSMLTKMINTELKS